MFVLAANYTTPGFNADSTAFRALSWAVRDWTFGAVLRYQSGAPIRVPASNNALFTQLRRTDNPAIWGGATTFWNRVPGQDLLLVDPNSKSFDPTRTLALNPAAWTDAAAGQFGTAAPYYNDYRWQRQPQESMSLGRNFVLHRDRAIVLNVRAELFNVFNRTFLSSPTATNPAAPTTCLGACNTGAALNAGYGFINTFNGAGTQPRTGQIVARFTF
jgi:hypothetical protein